VEESAVQLGVTLATSDPVVGDANINNQITRSRCIREVVDDFEVPALQARALGDSLRLDLVSSRLEERGNQSIIIIYYSWNGGRAEAVCAGGKGVRMRPVCVWSYGAMEQFIESPPSSVIGDISPPLQMELWSSLLNHHLHLQIRQVARLRSTTCVGVGVLYSITTFIRDMRTLPQIRQVAMRLLRLRPKKSL
jgi:hypothetical protein